MFRSGHESLVMNKSDSLYELRLCPRVPISSHLGIVLKAVQDGGVQIGSLPGVSFAGLRNGADIADHFRRLRPKFRRRDPV